MKVYCSRHREMKEVVGFERDNPKLSCGCVKTLDRNDQCRQALEKYQILLAIVNGVTLEQAQEQMVQTII